MKTKKINPFVCSFCWVSFEIIGELVSHVYSQHPNFMETKDDEIKSEKLESEAEENNADFEASIDQAIKLTSNFSQVNKTQEKAVENRLPQEKCYTLKAAVDDEGMIEYLQVSEQSVLQTFFPTNLDLDYRTTKEIVNDFSISKGPIYECRICLKKNPDRACFREHVKRCHLEPRFACSICTKKFPTKQQVISHKEVHKSNTKTPYLCTLCMRYYTSRRMLQRHRFLYHCDENKYRYQCSYCPRKFATKNIWDKHELVIHTKEGVQACNFCELKFPNKSRLFSHMIKSHYEEIFKATNDSLEKVSERVSKCRYCNLKSQRRFVQYHLFYNNCKGRKVSE